MFFLVGLPLAIAILAGATTRGGPSALRAGWLVALLLLPTWMTYRFGSLLLDFRTVAGVCGLIALMIGRKRSAAPGSTRSARLLLADVVALALVLIQVISQWRIGQFGPLTAPDIARRWLLPYVMGRLFFESSEDIAATRPWILKLLAGLSIYSMLESVLKFNIINKLLGKTYSVLEGGEGYRWGLKRAQGPLDHPIFFGMLLVMLLPWTIDAARRSLRGQGPKWWIATPFLLGGAILGTVSRGAQLSAVATLAVTFFFYKPRWRIPMIVFALLGGVAAYQGKQALSDVLSKWAGESQEESRIIQIDGEEFEYTGTNHRILLFKAYEQAIANVGAFGYGFEMRGIQLEESTAQRFGSIDDHYILFLLQHGYLAVGAFIILGLITLVNLGRTALNEKHSGSGLAGPLCGAMLAVTVSLLSVWFSPDFGAVWLFCAGLATNLRCLPVVEANETENGLETGQEPALPSVQRKLVQAQAPRRAI